MVLRWLLMIFLYSTCTLCFSKNNPDLLKENVFQTPKTSSQSGYIPVSGAKLYYQSFGQGRPIILIHGGPGLDQSYFFPQMLELSKHHQVIFYDQRGSGKSISSQLDNKFLNTDQFVQDIEQLRHGLGLKKIILLGHSWGGMLAMQYALKYPQNTEALILMNGAPATSEGFKAFGNEYLKRISPVQNTIDKIRHSQTYIQGDTTAANELFRTIFKKYLYKESNIQKLSVQFSPETAKNHEKIEAIFSKTFLNYDMRQKLHHLNLPTLVIHGVSDPIPLWTARQTSESIPNAKLVIIKKSGHFSYAEQPKTVFSAIDQFLLQHDL